MCDVCNTQIRSRTASGTILVAYGLYLIGGDEPRAIAVEIYDGCIAEDV